MRNLSVATIAEIRSRYLRGEPVQEIAAWAGVSHQLISYHGRRVTKRRSRQGAAPRELPKGQERLLYWAGVLSRRGWITRHTVQVDFPRDRVDRMGRLLAFFGVPDSRIITTKRRVYCRFGHLALVKFLAEPLSGRDFERGVLDADGTVRPCAEHWALYQGAKEADPRSLEVLKAYAGWPNKSTQE